LAFWVEIEWAFIPFLFLPIAILGSIALFGTNLVGKYDLSIRAISIISLIVGLGLAYEFVFRSGEQGSVGVMVLGAPILFLNLLIYSVLWLIQRFKKVEFNS